MNKEREKLIADFHRLLDAQDFESEEDLKKFMDGLVGQKIPEFPKEILTNEEKAKNLVFEAYEADDDESTEKIHEALVLDPDCIEAYEYLAITEVSPLFASPYYEKGISIGRKRFGGEYLKEKKGMFWGIHETRPFMRCMFGYAECLHVVGRVEESVAVLEELIELNPNDNQGVRESLLLYLIELDDREKYMRYSKMYEDDISAFMLFNHALFAFMTEGPSNNTNDRLKKAVKSNKHVAQLLGSAKIESKLPETYRLGSKEEAVIYASVASQVWQNTQGALLWLKSRTKLLT
jgi:tetratricopeptide (TPR) repeat protein